MTLIPGNIFDYNTQSIETDTSGWTVRSGPATLSQSGAHFRDGSHSLLATATGGGDIEIATANSFAVTPGSTILTYLSVWNSNSRTLFLQAEFYNSSNTLVYSLAVPATAYVIPASTWTQYALNVDVPATAATYKLVMRPQSVASGDLFYFDQMFAGPPNLAATVTPNQGLAYNAISVSGLSNWTTLTIQRTGPTGSVSTLRNANAVATGGVDTWAGFDVEAPLGAQCSYTFIASQPQPDGTTSTYQIVSPLVTIPVANAVGWLKSLSQSALNTQVTIQALSDVKRPSRQQVYPVVGRANPVVISDVLTGRTGTISLQTTGSTDYQSIMALLQPGTTLFLQATPGDYFADMYFVPGDVTEQRPASQSTDMTRIWQIDFTEVDSPSGMLTTIPGNSYLAVVSFGSYQEISTARTSYLAVLDTPYGSGPGGI